MTASKMTEGSVVELKVKFNEKFSTSRSLFIKEHVVRKKNQCKNLTDPTILVLNIPPFCDDNCLRRIFGGCGKITNIQKQKKPGKVESTNNESVFFPSPPVSGYYVAYISFQLENSIKRAMVMAQSQEEPVYLFTPENDVHTGVKKMCLDYLSLWPDTKKLQTEIDEYMEVYDAKVAEKEKKVKEKEGAPDEEGWITVTSGGRHPGFSRTEGNEIKQKAKMKRKRENEKESIKIYSYQRREHKREQIAELRRKFEEDKEKIRKMKAARKFKPFK